MNDQKKQLVYKWLLCMQSFEFDPKHTYLDFIHLHQFESLDDVCIMRKSRTAWFWILSTKHKQWNTRKINEVGGWNILNIIFKNKLYTYVHYATWTSLTIYSTLIWPQLIEEYYGTLVQENVDIILVRFILNQHTVVYFLTLTDEYYLKN